MLMTLRYTLVSTIKTHKKKYFAAKGVALNPCKSEVMFGTSHAVAMANIWSVTIASTIIAISDKWSWGQSRRASRAR